MRYKVGPEAWVCEDTCGLDFKHWCVVVCGTSMRGFVNAVVQT